MRECVKTAVFVGLACVVGLVAFLSRPVSHKNSDEDYKLEDIFPELAKASDVTRLEVVQFDDAKHMCKDPFVVAQVAGHGGKSGWKIPSHSNYPADAKEHLGEAASLLMHLKTINTAPGLDPEHGNLTQENIRRLHNEFGVVDPNPETVKASDSGVGTRITLKDKEDKVLASLIVGKQVGDQASQHYVRKPGQDPVYIVNIDTGKVSTKFEDWIERNLLGMNTMDLKQVDIQDYAIVMASDGIHGYPKHDGEYLLDYDFNATPAWKLSKDLRFDAAKKALVPQKLAADEELDTKKLDELKTAIDDLKIVDVERKPGAIPPDLHLRKEADLVGVESLKERGFFPVQDPDGVEGHFSIMSTKGDVAFQLSDGVRYVLRFGESTGESSAADKAKDKKNLKTDKKDEPVAGSNRYLFVMAEFNQDAIAKPVYEELPKEQKPADKKADDKKADAKKPGDKKADEKKADAKKADVKTPDAPKTEEKKPDAKQPEEKKTDAKKKPDALMADDKPADAKDDKDAKPAVAAEKKDATRKEEPKKEEKKVDVKADAKPADVKDAKPAVDAEKKDAGKTEEPKKEEKKVDLKAARERIEKENKRKLDEYNDKVAAGKKHKDELNNRFADWYYVISDDVYRKIHLTRTDLIKKKEAKDKAKDADGHDHEHEHDHDSLPASPASTLEQLKKDAPAAEKK